MTSLKTRYEIIRETFEGHEKQAIKGVVLHDLEEADRVYEREVKAAKANKITAVISIFSFYNGFKSLDKTTTVNPTRVIVIN